MAVHTPRETPQHLPISVGLVYGAECEVPIPKVGAEGVLGWLGHAPGMLSHRVLVPREMQQMHPCWEELKHP